MNPAAYTAPPLCSSWHRLRSAYHEAGHAVLGHWFGRYISEVSPVPVEYTGEFVQQGSRGNCLFDIFAEAEHGVPGWQLSDRNLNLAAIYDASMNVYDEHDY